MRDLEAQLAAEKAAAEAQRQTQQAAADTALKAAQDALNQSSVSIPPGAWGH